MTKYIETTGKTEEEAIEKALAQLGLERDDVSVELIERAKSGFLGLGGNPARVRVSYEAPGRKRKKARRRPPNQLLQRPAPRQRNLPKKLCPPRKTLCPPLRTMKRRKRSRLS